MVLVRMWGNGHAFSVDGNISGTMCGKSYLTICISSLKHVQPQAEMSYGVTELSRDGTECLGEVKDRNQDGSMELADL